MKRFAVVFLIMFSQISFASSIDCMVVGATDSRINNRPFIRFEFSNACKIDFNIYPGDLPWGSPASVLLEAKVLNGKGATLNRLGPLYGSTSPEMELKQGKTMQGYVDMPGWFDGFTAANDENDIAVSWQYFMPPYLGGDTRTGEVLFHRVK